MLLGKLRQAHIWRRILHERLTEPLHLNLLSLPVAVFGSYRTKVAFDLVVRQHFAYGLLSGADLAARSGVRSFSAIECGVGAGVGLLNLCRIARHVQKITGVGIRIVGFDSGTGLPAPRDYRDHPDIYRRGDFPMEPERLLRMLPDYATLVLGPLEETVPPFLKTMTDQAPLGFISIDVDYYSSAAQALALLSDPDPGKYLPLPVVYLDDIAEESHNSWCGELLAVSEFNALHPLRKIERHRFLRSRRLFKHARWLDHIYLLHVLDHPVMGPRSRGEIAQ
ncbi:MAG: hypothetical protein WA005_02350 [Candidatus Binataceae bacterium]